LSYRGCCFVCVCVFSSCVCAIVFAHEHGVRTCVFCAERDCVGLSAVCGTVQVSERERRQNEVARWDQMSPPWCQSLAWILMS
jgi:hypothetical protein